jgi:hypothetical protein
VTNKFITERVEEKEQFNFIGMTEGEIEEEQKEYALCY